MAVITMTLTTTKDTEPDDVGYALAEIAEQLCNMKTFKKYTRDIESSECEVIGSFVIVP